MKSLRIHCFQHVPFETPGCILNWTEKNGHVVAYTRFYESHSLPAPDDYDWLLVMGGPMGVNDEARYPWLAGEKEAIRKAIEADKTVIGICLGSQLIASVLGAEVYKNTEKEIGWFDIALTADGNNAGIFNHHTGPFKVFQWHGDTFSLPAGARHLAFSEACRNQAFCYGNKILALQFHFEVTETGIRSLIENNREELTGGKFIQSESEILEKTEFIRPNNQAMYDLLDRLSYT